MISRVCRRVIVALIVLGWVSLSCFDVVEDLDEILGGVAVSSTRDHSTSSSKQEKWRPVANDIVESAGYTEQADAAPASLFQVIFDLDPVLHCCRYFQRHKLYRVFLI
jgi:hypothetical protein